MLLLLLHIISNDSNWLYSYEKSLPMGFYQTKGIFKYLELIELIVWLPKLNLNKLTLP